MPQLLPDPHASDLEACRALLREGSKSFAAASLLLPKRVRDPAAAVYAFCRVADDAVDRGGGASAVAELRERLDRIYEGNPIDSPVDRAFSRVACGQGIPRSIVDALIEGFAWDAEGRRYTTLSELCAYGARVAATVGVMMTLLMGERSRVTLARACDLGVAMQLTNIARDVGEDARAGRLYLPLSWLEEAQIEPLGFAREPRHSEALAKVIERLLRYADGLYARADRGIAMLPPDCRSAIRAARLIYADIGREIMDARFDSISRRAVVSGPRKIMLVARSLFGRQSEVGDGQRPVPALRETQFLIDAVASNDEACA